MKQKITVRTYFTSVRRFIYFHNKFTIFKNDINLMDIRIELFEESIEITVKNNTIKFLIKSIKLVPNSLSAMNVTNDWVCFRAQIKSDSAFGCFQTEVVTNATPNINVLKNSIENIQSVKGHSCNIICTCCKNVLSKEIFVKRVLPIPDMNYDLSEWFCCKHNHTTADQNLTPLEFDIFYGSFFFIVHKSLFNNHLKLEGNTIPCNICLQYIGKINTDNSFKLWSCSIDYNLLSNSKIERPFTTDPFIDFLIAIKTTMTGMIGEEIILQSFIGKTIHSLILKPMDWQLNLMTEPKIMLNDNVMTLHNISVVKVLYKYEINKDIIDAVHKTYCEVGYLVIEAGLKHLSSSTKRFPQIHGTTSDFYIGHICLETPT